MLAEGWSSNHDRSWISFCPSRHTGNNKRPAIVSDVHLLRMDTRQPSRALMLIVIKRFADGWVTLKDLEGSPLPLEKNKTTFQVAMGVQLPLRKPYSITFTYLPYPHKRQKSSSKKIFLLETLRTSLKRRKKQSIPRTSDIWLLHNERDSWAPQISFLSHSVTIKLQIIPVIPITSADKPMPSALLSSLLRL